MNIDKVIEKWQEKHSLILEEYSKGNANNEVMKMYRSQMKNVLEFIDDLKQLKPFITPPDVNCTTCQNEDLSEFEEPCLSCLQKNDKFQFYIQK